MAFQTLCWILQLIWASMQVNRKAYYEYKLVQFIVGLLIDIENSILF